MSIFVGPSAYATSSEPLRFVGKVFSCLPGVSDHDVTPTTSVRLKGGTYWVTPPAVGDRISLTILDPEGAVAAVYCDRLPVPPFQALAEINSPTAGLVPLGFTVRITYERETDEACELGISLMWFVGD